MAVPPSANLLPQVSHYAPDAICNSGCGILNFCLLHVIWTGRPMSKLMLNVEIGVECRHSDLTFMMAETIKKKYSTLNSSFDSLSK